MSDDVQPPRFGGQEPGVPGQQPPAGTGPAASPWASPYPTAGASQPSAPQQQPYYPPPGYTPALGGPPAPGGGRGNRRLAILGGGVAAVVVAGIVTAVVVLNGNSGKPASANAAGSASSAAVAPPTTAPAPATTAVSTAPATPAAPCSAATSLGGEPVGYRACGTAARSVGIPTYDTTQAHRTYTATFRTNRGDIVFSLDGANAPYTVYSFVYLVGKQYFDNTRCHRLTTTGIYVLQCGDPTGTGTGGPGYQFQDENLGAFGQASASGSVTYPAGTVAMANSGFGTNGSQFFLVYRDSPLAPLYTPFGRVTQGMDILQSIAAQGSDNSNGSGDGSPNEPVQIEQVTVG